MTTAHQLPQGPNALYLTDGGLETTLVYHEEWELPEFAAFVLLNSTSGRATLVRYYERYLQIARNAGCGFILDTPTWRASAGWGIKLGYTANEIIDINQQAVELLREVAAANPDVHSLISGCIGPSDDGYQPSTLLSADAAEAYHRRQVCALADSQVDMLWAGTMTYADEAIGITRAAQDANVPVAVSFTLETDGRLPSGTSLGDAIAKVDTATNQGPVYYMINCAHPSHFLAKLNAGGEWRERIGGVRANASSLSHAELDAATELDEGDPQDLAQAHTQIAQRLPNLSVVGGCCGTDHRHVGAIAQSLLGTGAT